MSVSEDTPIIFKKFDVVMTLDNYKQPRINRILMANRGRLIIIDFVNAKIYYICHKDLYQTRYGLNDIFEKIQIYMTENKIHINDINVNDHVHAFNNIDKSIGYPNRKDASVTIDLENSSVTSNTFHIIDVRLPTKNINTEMAPVIEFDDKSQINTLDPLRLTSTEYTGGSRDLYTDLFKGRYRELSDDTAIYMASKSTNTNKLIKLHPRDNDPDGWYKNYFCWHDEDTLRIGIIKDNELYTDMITNPLFKNIKGYILTHDNILILLTTREELHPKTKHKFFPPKTFHQIIMIDCNNVSIILQFEFPDDNIFHKNMKFDIFVELPAIKKDYNTLLARYGIVLSHYFIPPLTAIVFSYIFEQPI
ncbi:MAG: hypothetical protein Edafosvirus4_50 [Edafosvirus sp.]|uniref:Uncharacterized protein n=1 Tax=Edafosvirus sp. TaxID=2487765 RepID=A0A3G4ZT39_9VIRU|nr:MAG: hypothetical protein Edafosvirus4_50 [Edafosvirus sp.]